MPFRNPVFAGTTLIREALHSPDYVSGESGWSINRDGTVEFNNATLRGTLQTPGVSVTESALTVPGDMPPGVSGFIMTTDIPHVIASKYTSPPDVPTAVKLYMTIEPDFYWFEAMTPSQRIYGYVRSGVAFETHRQRYSDSAGLAVQWYGYNGDPTQVVYGPSNGTNNGNQTVIYFGANLVSNVHSHLDWAGSASFLSTISVDGYTLGEWHDYTPVWSSNSNPQPNIGDGTIVGRWTRVGKTVHVNGRLQPGSTTTYGTGFWRVSLPFPFANSVIGAGNATAFDASTAANRMSLAALTTGTDTLRFIGNGDVSATSPFTWAAGDQLRWSFTYEAE